MELSGGAVGRLGPVTVAIQPSLIYTENRSFPLASSLPIPTRSLFANPWYPRRGIGGQSIDLPQRFGSEDFWTIDLGPSYVRADLGPAAVGFSNQNMWWGPAMRNAIVLSDNAPGFLHAFLGTSSPTSIAIGRVEARWIWGRLAESEYFDSDPTNDRRFVTGLVLGFVPKPLPGLHLGAARLFYELIPAGGSSSPSTFWCSKELPRRASVRMEPCGGGGN